MIQKQLNNIPYSVLDLATVVEGKTPSDTFKASLDLAQHAESWGYTRYWLAEHHNMISGCHWTHRRWYKDHPGRIRRYYAAESLSTGHRRAIWNTCFLISRKD
jgi:alkanesulfonate monooxygenase SsuD/methylene tetrahydromethanopterin reductase-like flavin-dependent oxidoreductase (luciferase family)